MKNPTFKQWDHLDPADKARRVSIIAAELQSEISESAAEPKDIFDSSRWEGMNAHAVYCVAARLDGDLELAQEMLDGAKPYSGANTRYATWIKFKRLIKPYRSLLALAHKPNLVADAMQLLANDLGLDEELQLELIQETNPQLVGDVGANPAATLKVMELVSDYKNVIARARLAENPGLSNELIQKLLNDKVQAQIGLAKNWMISNDTINALFETLDPGVVSTLLNRKDVNGKDCTEFVVKTISKHESSTKYETTKLISGLQDWLDRQLGKAKPDEDTFFYTPTSSYTPPKVEIVDEILEKYKHDPLGYQHPDIPEEWLLKNIKNRSDEIKKDVLLNPSLPVEAMKILAMDKKPEIRKALGLLPNCPDDLKALVALQ